MATATHSTPVLPGLSLGQRLGAFYEGFVAAQTKRAIYRRTLAELSGLSNRELADLGLSRSGLRRVALDAAYGN